MARNEEKARSLFSRWSALKSSGGSGINQRRPAIASDCDSIADANKWRHELISEITKKISEIKNASIGEHRIREINDEINKLMKTKYHWDKRIVELGGAEVGKRKKQFYDIEGKELPGQPGYKYYGAAKDLPGVRELFADAEEEITKLRNKRSRSDIYKNITPDYYGYRDDDDNVLIPREMAMEKKLIEKSIKEWKKSNNNLVDDNGLQEYKEMKSFLYHLKQNPNQKSVPQTNTSVDNDNNKELSEIERKKKILLSKLM